MFLLENFTTTVFNVLLHDLGPSKVTVLCSVAVVTVTFQLNKIN